MSWLLIDGNNWFAQCEYAAPGMSISNLLRRIQTVTRQVPHSRAIVCWDGANSWRREFCPQYKAARTAKSDAYITSLVRAKAAVAELLPDLEVEAYEADDLIATLVQWAKGEGERAVIFSADKDLHQLLESGQVTQVTQVHRVSVNQCRFDTVTAASLLERYGVTPWQWVDYRVITGDKSDGISGCPGLGPDAAKKLLTQAGSLDRYYADSQLRWRVKLTAKQVTALDSFRDSVPKKRRLMTLCDCVPVPASWVLTPGSGVPV